MEICDGTLPKHGKKGQTGGKCGALAEPGMRSCAAHLKQAGWKRCACGTWAPPQDVYQKSFHCPSCGLYFE